MARLEERQRCNCALGVTVRACRGLSGLTANCSSFLRVQGAPLHSAPQASEALMHWCTEGIAENAFLHSSAHRGDVQSQRHFTSAALEEAHSARQWLWGSEAAPQKEQWPCGKSFLRLSSSLPALGEPPGGRWACI